jgi:hypothetical protein
VVVAVVVMVMTISRKRSVTEGRSLALGSAAPTA